ncbi:MAG TPA: ABC transporter permease [Tepidisphaeraceae bacterium]|nr:ABC transporter permease [Tepidisphaeraceae bacterium]
MISRAVRTFVTRILPPVLVFVCAAVALELYVRIRQLPMYYMPRPTDVLRIMLDAEQRRRLLASLLVTTEAALIGFTASVIVGILIAIALAASRWVRRAFYPYTLFFQTVPIVAIAPLLVIWFQAGLTSVSVSAFIVSVFPVIANTLAGLLATEPALLDLFQLYGAGSIERLWKLRLPYAMPSIVTGLRVAAGLAVIGTVVGEFLVGTLGESEGLGVRIVSAMKNGRTDLVFAAVLIASLLGLALFAVVNLAGHLMLRRWHTSEQGA